MMGDVVDLNGLKTIFWDVDMDDLSWDENRDFIIRRVLTYGSLEMIRWLRRKLGDSTLSAWLERHQGGGLSPRQLRYWQVILGIPDPVADRWVELSRKTLWHRRMN